MQPYINGPASEVTADGPPEIEVPSRPMRRRFTAKYKLSILQEADRCREPGEIGALLRREGLYSSLLSTWRRQRDEGALSSFSKKRGRRAKKSHQERELEDLRKANERLEKRLEQAELIIDVQKKLSRILDVDLPPTETDE